MISAPSPSKAICWAKAALLTTACLAAALIGAMAGSGGSESTEEDRLQHRSQPSPSPSIALVPVKRRSLPLIASEETEANRLLHAANLPATERAQNLRNVLLRWARRDLPAVTNWLLSAMDAGEVRDGWLSNVLLGLAETDAAKAFHHGLRLNAEQPTSVVPPETLLEISLKHLTAGEAIQAMEQPLKGRQARLKAYAFHPGMDFKRLGLYLLTKAYGPDKTRWLTEVRPSNLLEAWAEVDAQRAKQYTGMFQYALGKPFHRREAVNALIAQAQQTPTAAMVQQIRDMLEAKPSPQARSELAVAFTRAGGVPAELFQQATEQLPWPLRTSTGVDSLLLNFHNNGPAAEAARLRSMRLIAGSMRVVEIQRNLYLRPELAAELRRHLQTLGHSEAEIARMDRNE